MNQNLLNLATQQLRLLSPQDTCVVLHPATYPIHRYFIRHLLADAQGVYLHITPAEEGLSDLLKALRDALAVQLGVELGKLETSPTKAGAQFATALNSQARAVLVLDGYDLVKDEKAAAFVAALAGGLGEGRRVVISSRQLPLGLPAGVMLPVDDRRLLVDYTRPREKDILEVRALGPCQAFINGRPLTQWDGQLPKSLFYFVIDRAMTTRHEIFATFWGALEKKEATNVFHVTKRKVSEVLGQDLTTYGAGFYRIADNLELHYDVVVFQEAVQAAEICRDDAEAMRLYQDAIYLYRGHFLSILDADWITTRREELLSVYTEALTGLARLYQHQGNNEQALGLYLRAAATMPQREDLARTIMGLYQQRNQPHRALAAYGRLAEELRAALRVEPSPETERLALQIQQGVKV